MWTIGIVDDKLPEHADIQVAIYEKVPDKSEISFKDYELERRNREDILHEIMDDITCQRIHTLIVDYKLDTSVIVLKGWEIVDYFHEKVPEFPVIIMTNAPEESKESPYIDADKVYPKRVFLNTEDKNMPEMVKNILLNIQRYEKRRSELEGQLSIQLAELDKDSTNENVISSIVNIENSLSKYKEMDRTMLDKTFDLDDLKGVIKEIKEIEEYF